MNIFIIKLFTSNTYKYEENAQEYCFDKNRIAIGWGFNKDVININGNETPEELVQMNIDYNNEHCQESLSRFKTAYNNLQKMKKGDFVWTQNNKGHNFRLGQITDDKPFIDKNNLLIGLARQCEWHTVDFNDVPGEIINSYQRKTITLIMKHNLSDFEEYFNYLYDPEDYSLTQKLDYKQLLHYDDLEDLVGIYLQKKEEYQYYLIPSTNKISTKLIEYELRREKDGKIEKACVQCKTGDSRVPDDFFNIEDFKDYKIYISTMNDDNYNDKGKNVTTIFTDILWNWAKENKSLLPGRIQKYIDICK